MTQHVSLQYAAVGAERAEPLERTWLPRLPEAKRASVLRLRERADREASLLGVALLAAVLGELRIDFDATALVYPTRGKPHLPGGPDFSISHARGVVACAVARTGRVGLDLEAAGTVATATAGRVLSASERAALDQGTLDATDAWVMKEAVVKLLGRGIGALAAVRLRDGHASYEGESLRLHPVAIEPGYVAWLASDAAASQIVVRAGEPVAPLPAAR